MHSKFSWAKLLLLLPAIACLSWRGRHTYCSWRWEGFSYTFSLSRVLLSLEPLTDCWSPRAVAFSGLSTPLSSPGPCLLCGWLSGSSPGLRNKSPGLSPGSSNLLASLDKLHNVSSLTLFFYNKEWYQRVTVKTKCDNGCERHVNCTHCVNVQAHSRWLGSGTKRIRMSQCSLWWGGAGHRRWFGSIDGYWRVGVCEEEGRGRVVSSMISKWKGILQRAAGRWWGLFWEGLCETQKCECCCCGAQHREQGESCLHFCTDSAWTRAGEGCWVGCVLWGSVGGSPASRSMLSEGIDTSRCIRSWSLSSEAFQEWMWCGFERKRVG